MPVGPDRAFGAWVDIRDLAHWWWPQWPDTVCGGAELGWNDVLDRLPTYLAD